MLNAVLRSFTDDEPQAIKRLKQFLAIPSVSTDPAYGHDTARAGQWVADTLTELGFNTQIYATNGHPIVLAQNQADTVPSNAPHALFYGHYDVQPPDPLEEWTSPPFEPAIRDSAIVARGASDDKGQVCCFFEALRAWKRTHGGLPLRVTVLIEGEEECGSVHLRPFMESHRDQLDADIAIISDTTMWDRQTMAITYGLRGLLYFDIQLHHSNRDLHSGMYGGVVANPATVLAGVLGRLFDEEHRVTVPGFYDDVTAVTEEERQRWAALDFDEQSLLGGIGVLEPYGEAGHTTLERRWARPSCDINGLYGGYGGSGAKTIIPSSAGAKVSFRLAPQQDAGKIADQFTRWLTSQPVHGCRWEITDLGQADPVVVKADSPYVAAAVRAIERCFGTRPVLVREGATIPVVADFKKMLGIDSLLIGFGLPDDRVHAPNEKFSLDSFALGCRTHAALLAELAAMK